MLAPILAELLNGHGGEGEGINYGPDKVRFPAPLPVGAQFRGSGVLTEVSEGQGRGAGEGDLPRSRSKDAPQPALVAECLFRFFT